MKIPDKELLAALAAAVGLAGSLATSLAKAFDSISLSSKRSRELKRIDDLTALLQKIQAENALGSVTMANLTVQIEAEINLALQCLEKNRHHAAERRKEHDDSDLGLLRRAFLLYWPKGIRAWIPHVLAYALTVFCLFGVVGLGLDNESNFHWSTFWSNQQGIVGLFLFLLPLLPLRHWALWERKRWCKTHVNTMFLVPGSSVAPPPPPIPAAVEVQATVRQAAAGQ